MIFHLHDHRPFCPNGDRLYPQGGGICRIAMSMQGCGWHSLIHGCAYGPRTRTLRLIGIRSQIARAVRASDATIAFSHYVARVATHNGVPSSKMRVLAPALEEAAFAAVPPPRPRSDAVLFAGRIVPSKGARSLVRALARIAAPNRPLLRIAGEGPDVQATRGEARALGVQLEVLGRLEPAVLRAAYDAATLVAMPSLWAEPFGLVGIEAFARGRPVVAYDAGAIAEWLGASAGAGHVVALGDEAGLASAISALLSSQWDHAAAQAFAAGSTYRLDRHVTSIEAVYRNE